MTWHSHVKTVVLLDEQMRQAGPENRPLADLLNALRIGRFTEEHRVFLNSRVLKRFDPKSGKLIGTQPVNLVPQGATVITPTNGEREAFNDAATLAAARASVTVVRILATITRKKQSVSEKLLRWLHNTASEDVMDKLPPVLDLYVGQRVRVVHNLATLHGVANGTLAVVKQIHWPAGVKEASAATPTTVLIHGQPVRVRVARVLPAYIEIRITDRPARDTVLVPGFAPGCYPVTPQKLSVELELGKIGVRSGSTKQKKPS